MLESGASGTDDTLYDLDDEKQRRDAYAQFK